MSSLEKGRPRHELAGLQLKKRMQCRCLPIGATPNPSRRTANGQYHLPCDWYARQKIAGLIAGQCDSDQPSRQLTRARSETSPILVDPALMAISLTHGLKVSEPWDVLVG